jgi:sulfoxide reductase heme-binding subunit YedZ
MIRRLGPHWQRLHQLVYVIAVGAILHYLWLVKADTLKPLIHAGILLLLLALRAWFKRRAGARRRSLAPGAS